MPHLNVSAADEIDAVVIDVGSSLAKAGYAGEDAPKAVFPSVGFQNIFHIFAFSTMLPPIVVTALNCKPEDSILRNKGMRAGQKAALHEMH